MDITKPSIMFPDQTDPAAEGTENPQAVYDLSVDRLLELIEPDMNGRDYFLRSVGSPPLKVENILLRQQTLADFLEIPGLFERFSNLFGRWADLRREWNDARSKTAGRAHTGASTDADYYRAAYRLQVSAIYTRRILTFIRGIYNELSAAQLRSPALTAVRDSAAALVSKPEFGELDRIAARYDAFAPSNASFDLDPAFNEYMYITDVRAKLTGDLYTEDKRKERADFLEKLIGRIMPKKGEAPSDGGEYQPIRSVAVEDKGMTGVLTDAVSDLASVMSGAASALYGIFEKLPAECGFYRAAIKYVEFLQEKGIEPVFPEILTAESRRLDIKALKDGYLCAMSDLPSASDVIPNDVSVGYGGGLVVVGDNNTGKTVYLRSVGTAQLLAQSGLPIICEKASISVRSSIYTQFAAAEKDFTVSDVSGRFEEEVKQMAKINSELDGGSLVLLNETFQTTAYAEGAAGLLPILRHWSEKGAAWLLATHLRELLPMMRSGEALILETKPGYRLERKE